jgi:hypothetical protein
MRASPPTGITSSAFRGRPAAPAPRPQRRFRHRRGEPMLRHARTASPDRRGRSGPLGSEARTEFARRGEKGVRNERTSQRKDFARERETMEFGTRSEKDTGGLIPAGLAKPVCFRHWSRAGCHAPAPGRSKGVIYPGGCFLGGGSLAMIPWQLRAAYDFRDADSSRRRVCRRATPVYPRNATICPPSTTIVAPAMKRPASEASSSSAPSRSPSWPKRPVGMSRLSFSPASVDR